MSFVRILSLVLVLSFAMTAICCAQDSEDNRYYHFQSSKESADGWAWGKAKAKAKNGLLVVKEADPNGDAGDVYTADRLPYARDSRVRIHVSEVPSGYYSLQLMCFKKRTYAGEVGLVKNSTNTESQILNLKDIEVPEGTDEIGFKFWVAGDKAAVSHLKELDYWQVTDDDDRNKVLVADLDKEELWTLENVTSERTDHGLQITLAAGKNFGAVVYTKQSQVDPESKIVVELGTTVQGAVKVQAVIFSKVGELLESVTLGEKLMVGRHEFLAKEIQWPEGAEKVVFKLWLEGDKNASTLIRGLKVLN